MKKVPLAYAVHDNTLSMQPVSWPEQCPCCKSKEVSARYDLSYQADQIAALNGVVE